MSSKGPVLIKEIEVIAVVIRIVRAGILRVNSKNPFVSPPYVVKHTNVLALSKIYVRFFIIMIIPRPHVDFRHIREMDLLNAPAQRLIRHE